MCPDWVKQYATLFKGESKNAPMLENCGGWSLKEMEDKKL